MYTQANYYAVLPAPVRYNPKLTARSVLLYGVLRSLARATGEAYAANEYLMSVLEISDRTVNRLLAELVAEKYITIRYEYKGDTKEIAKRFIRLNELPQLFYSSNPQAFYDAIIPSHILEMSELSVQAKILYAEISATTPDNGYCGKSAAYFAEILHSSEPTVRRWIKELQDADAVRVEMEYNGDTREIKRRRIYLTDVAYIVEKRAEMRQDGSKTPPSGNPPIGPQVANTPERGRNSGMLIFDTTYKKSEKRRRGKNKGMLIFDTTPEKPKKRGRKRHGNRKKATERLRL